jgi:hypothetical protein
VVVSSREVPAADCARAPSPTIRDPDHYVRRLVEGLFIGLGVYVLFWPTVVLLLILAASFGY